MEDYQKRTWQGENGNLEMVEAGYNLIEGWITESILG